jgi:hypothetical protein
VFVEAEKYEFDSTLFRERRGMGTRVAVREPTSAENRGTDLVICWLHGTRSAYRHINIYGGVLDHDQPTTRSYRHILLP